VKLPVVVVSAIVLLALAIFILLRLDLQSNAPQFTRSSPPAFGSNDTVHFLNFLTARPFEGGKMCIGVASSRTNWQNLILDIEKRRVLGQVTNGWPVTAFFCGIWMRARIRYWWHPAQTITTVSLAFAATRLSTRGATRCGGSGSRGRTV
jgi:hypothetical protein